MIALGHGRPGVACVRANAQALARYAALCQEAGLVPIVEPEVLMTGNHTLERCQGVTGDVLAAVFDELAIQGVALDGLILKPNMILASLDSLEQASAEQVASATIECLLRNVPRDVSGIAFLSGGQPSELATTRLNAINVMARNPERPAPWPLVFSFARAIQQPALEIWHGDDAHYHDAQDALHHRAMCNHAALRGEYDRSMELPAMSSLVHYRSTVTGTVGVSSL